MKSDNLADEILNNFNTIGVVAVFGILALDVGVMMTVLLITIVVATVVIMVAIDYDQPRICNMATSVLLGLIGLAASFAPGLDAILAGLITLLMVSIANAYASDSCIRPTGA